MFPGKNEASVQEAEAGGAYGKSASRSMAAANKKRKAKRCERRLAEATDDGTFSSLDFLATPGIVICNLPVDSSGVVSIPMSSILPLGGNAVVTIVACDDFHTDSAFTSTYVPSTRSEFRPLQLQKTFDLDAHIVQKQGVSALQPGQSVDITVASDTKAEEYGSLDKVYSLFCTISSNSTLQSEFAFLPNWSSLSDSGTPW